MPSLSLLDTSWLTILSTKHTALPKTCQGIFSSIGDEDNGTSIASVTPRWASTRRVFCTVKGDKPTAAITSTHFDGHYVHQLGKHSPSVVEVLLVSSSSHKGGDTGDTHFGFSIGGTVATEWTVNVGMGFIRASA